MKNHDFEHRLPKQGSVHMEFKKCGKPECHCTQGVLHGPYFYLHRRVNGRQTKKYVPIALLGQTIRQTMEYRHHRQNISSALRDLKEDSHDRS